MSWGRSISFEGENLNRLCYPCNFWGAIFDNRFKGNYSLRIMCRKKILFGDDCLVAWNCTFADGDGYVLFENGERIHYDEAIQIGNHVWFCVHSTVLKGTQLKDGSVVEFRGLCN